MYKEIRFIPTEDQSPPEYITQGQVEKRLGMGLEEARRLRQLVQEARENGISAWKLEYHRARSRGVGDLLLQAVESTRE